MRAWMLGVLLFCALLGLPGKAESAAHALYLEGGGAGLLYTLNYELRLVEPFALRVGFGYWLLAYTVPVMANFLWGPAPHHGEIGLGVMFGEFVESLIPPSRPKFAAFLVGHLGYRYHPLQGGLVFRLGFTPLVRLNTFEFYPWGGISLGIAF